MKRYNQILYTKIAKFQSKHKLSFCYSIRRLAKDLGVELVPYRGPDLLSISEDGFSVLRNGVYHIFYNPDMSSTRLNFTIAHEMGHIILGHHRFMKGRILASSADGRILETHANIFARNLLMPITRVKDYLQTKSIGEIAEIFEVSNHMVRVRLEVLELDIQEFNNIKEDNIGIS